MIVIYAARFGIHTSGRKPLQRLRIEAISVAEVPYARNDGRHPIIAVRMRLDRGVRGHEQQDRVKPRFCRIPKEHFCVNSSKTRTPDLIAVERAGSHFRRRQAHLGKRLSS